MKIIMLHTRYGSEDGFAVRLFLRGQEYEIADCLAAYFISKSCAKLSTDPVQPRGSQDLYGEKK